METGKCTAVVLAAGSGSRMKSNVAKQFLELDGRPLIYYALNAVEQSEIIDECILVTGQSQIEWVQKEIVERFRFGKVRAIVAGGTERCFSVANAMEWLAREEGSKEAEEGYVFIHDGARPFLTEDILKRLYQKVQSSKACVAAMPSKDTVKIADENGYAAQTPERKLVWNVQTPQVFERSLIIGAYENLIKAVERDSKLFVTDDASVVELFTNVKVALVEGSYENMKITTPEDMVIAKALLEAEKSKIKNWSLVKVNSTL